jgi:YD repeat-containing protein
VSKRRLAIVLGLVALTVPGGAFGSAVYTYDKAGRLLVARYDNGMCVAYTYDANGNRTSQTNLSATAVWGAGIFGCFNWTP